MKKRVSSLVSWCFEPSQPQRITSGLWMKRTISHNKLMLKGIVHYQSLKKNHRTLTMSSKLEEELSSISSADSNNRIPLSILASPPWTHVYRVNHRESKWSASCLSGCVWPFPSMRWIIGMCVAFSSHAVNYRNVCGLFLACGELSGCVWPFPRMR